MAKVRVLQDTHWGRLTVDQDDLLEKLAAASGACMEAARAAQWRTESDGIINSSIADTLGALSTVIDGLIDQFDSPPETVIEEGT